MAQFDNLDMRLSVKDDATAAMKRAAEAQRELTDAMRSAREEAKNGSDAHKSLAGDIFKGVAAWDIAKEAALKLKDALVELAMAGVEDERSQTRVTSTLESANMATDAAREAVDKYKESMVELGFDGDSAEQSMARLVATTGSVEQAQKLGGLAADLAADRQISLSEATTVLNQVVTGNQRVLKSYGVTMDDNASSAEALAALQEKVGGRAKDMASDTQGAIDIAKAKWGEITDKIGGFFTPTLKEALDWLNKQMTAFLNNKAAMDQLQRAIYQTGQFFKGLGLTVWATIKTLVNMGLTGYETAKLMITAAKDIVNAFTSVGDNLKTIIEAAKKAMTGDFAGAAETLKNRIKGAFGATETALSEFNASQQANAEDLTKTWSEAGGAFVQAFSPTNFQPAVEAAHQASERVKTDFSGIGAAGGKSATEVAAAKKKIADAMNGLSTDYRDVEASIEESLAKLEDEHKKTAASIGSKIGDLVRQLGELDAAYKKTTQGFDTSQAEGVVGQEAKIADLKRQLADEQKNNDKTAASGQVIDPTRFNELQAELQKEQAAYDAYVKSNALNDADLAEARRRAGETQFERDMEDLAAKRTAAQQDYDEKKKQLQQTLKDEQDALAQEAIIYAAKRDQYAQTAQAALKFKDDYVGALKDMKAQTDQSADAMKQKLNEIKNTLADIESAKNQAKIASASSAAVSGGTGKVDVNIDLGGVVVQNGADADALVQKMSDKLIQTLRLAGLASG